jgi:hypothetical protein
VSIFDSIHARFFRRAMKKRFRRLAVGFLFGAIILQSVQPVLARTKHLLLAQPAPAFSRTAPHDWLNSFALFLAELRGQVLGYRVFDL